MNLKLRLSQQKESRIVECSKYIEKHYSLQITGLREKAKRHDRTGIKADLITILTEIYRDYGIDAFVGDLKPLKKMLLKKVDPSRRVSSKIPEDKKNKLYEEYCEFCYIITRSIFWAVRIGMPGGESYTEFVERLLKTYEIQASDAVISNLAGRYKKYLSDTYNKKEDFIHAILSERTTHSGTAVKNKRGENGSNGKKEKNGSLLYKAIPPFAKTTNEFEFLFRKKNKSDKYKADEVDQVTEQIERVTREKIGSVLSQKKWNSEDLKKIQNEYASLRIKKIPEMKEEEMEAYWKIKNIELEFIKAYAKFPYKTMEVMEWKHYWGIDDLTCHYFTRIPESRLEETSYVLVMLIQRLCNNLEDLNNQEILEIWEVMPELLESSYDEFQAMVDETMFPLTLPEIQIHWKNQKNLSIKASEKRIKDEFVDKWLIKETSGLEDFIKLCMLTQYIDPNEYDTSTLSKAILHVFSFIEACNKKMQKISIPCPEGVRILPEMKALQDNLGNEGIAWDEENFDYLYAGTKAEQDYFEWLYNSRYVRLYRILANSFTSNACGVDACKLGNGENRWGFCIVNRYIRSVLPKYTNKVNITKEYKGRIEEVLLSAVIGLLYSDYITDMDEFDPYPIKQQILEMFGKYNLEEEIGF